MQQKLGKLLQELFFGAFVLCLSFSTLNTKIAGSAWGIWVMFGIYALFFSAKDRQITVDKATTIWLNTVLIYCIVLVAMLFYWEDSHKQLHHTWRLLSAALAMYVLVSRFVFSTEKLKLLYWTLVAACFVAAVLAFKMGRSTPSNPIAWAAGVGFLVCVLLPCCLQTALGPALRWACALGALAGIWSIFLSLSRGAFGIALWLLLFIVCMAYSRYGFALLKNRWFWVAVTVFGSLVLWLIWNQDVQKSIASVAFVQRLQAAVVEWEGTLQNFEDGHSFRSSIGARLHLWSLAWQSFWEAPFLGHGIEARIETIRNYPDSIDMNGPYFGHFHNQFLNHMVDYGVLGLLALLWLFSGLGRIAWQARQQPVVFWQTLGILFFAFSTLLSNVNLGHNYFATIWALAMVVVCAQSAWDKPLQTVAPPKP